MDKKSVSSKSEKNQEQVSFEWEFESIEGSLRKLNFIREGFKDLGDGEEDLWAEMIECVLPGIIENLEDGFSGLQGKLSINRPQSAVKGA